MDEKYIIKKISNDIFYNIEYSVAQKCKNINELNYCFNKEKDDFYTYLHFPYYAKGDLFDYLYPSIPLSEKEGKKYVKQMLNCVKILNDINYVHLDIKLENFLVKENNKLLLTDFGCCHPIDNRILKVERKNIGTNHFIAPEIKNFHYHTTSDIWSIGVCMYNILKGKILYENLDDFLFSKKKIDCFSEEANNLINSMLREDPLKRINVEEALDHIWLYN